MKALARKQEIQIIERDTALWTTSIDIAEKFSKRHDSLLRTIRELECSSQFRLLNFVETEYQDSHGRFQPGVDISRDGFTMLVMGFTGKKAMAWKEKYITAFNAMERHILSDAKKERIKASKQGQLLWQEARSQGKIERKEFTDAIKRLKELADEQNPENNAHNYYTRFTKTICSILFNIKNVQRGIRDEIPASALRKLQMIEGQVAEWVNDLIDKGVDYHEPYKVTKERVHSLVGIIGNIDLSVPTHTKE